MADQQVWYDLDFHFSSGNRLMVEVLEGRDSIQDTTAITKVTIRDGDTERTVTIHRDKLDAVESTKRVVNKELTGEWQREATTNQLG